MTTSKYLSACLALLILGAAPNLAHATVDVHNCQELQDINNNLSDDYVLAQDIDCSGFAGFVPLGSFSSPFTGSLDGQGHHIRGVTITNLSQNDLGNDIGLFGFIESATISNVILENFSIVGWLGVGALVGTSDLSTITNVIVKRAHVSATYDVAGGLIGSAFRTTIVNSSAQNINVSARAEAAGGLVGSYSRSEGTNEIRGSYARDGLVRGSFAGGLVGYLASANIVDSYSTVEVTGAPGGGSPSYQGGLVGVAGGFAGALPESHIINSYAAGKVYPNKNDPAPQTGGVIGKAFEGFVKVSGTYWDKQATGQNTDADPNSIGRNTAEMYTQATFVGWDFNDTWRIEEGTDYPYLQWENRHYIFNCDDLQAMNNDLGAYYALAGDIDCSETQNWNAGAGFIPVGISDQTQNPGIPFTGHFDGLGHSINDLYIDDTVNSTEIGSNGLFGAVHGATIANVHLKNVYVNGIGNSGGLIGDFISGFIINVHVDGKVTGNWVGGLVGYAIGFSKADPISIDRSSTNVEVYAVLNPQAYGVVGGGLMGYGGFGPITNSFSTGTISNGATYYIALGGLAGYAGNTAITNCYSTAPIISNGLPNNDSGNYVGGLVGFFDSVNSQGSLTDSYAAGVITINGGAHTHIGGLIGGRREDPNEVKVTPLDSYWDIQTTGQLHSVGSPDTSGKTTAQMKMQLTFAGWDFVDIWGIHENQSYPFLQWQVDEVAPSVVITSPLNNSVVAKKAVVTIYANAADDFGVTKVEFYVNGVLSLTDATMPYSFAWTVPNNGNAKYSLQAKAYDAIGHVGVSNIVSVATKDKH